MTVCNMAIEAGARAGLVAVDETTIAYVKGRPYSPDGRRVGRTRCATGSTLQSDAGAHFDRVVELDAAHARAAGHLGHVAGDGASRSTTACPTRSARRTPASATRWSAR